MNKRIDQDCNIDTKLGSYASMLQAYPSLWAGGHKDKPKALEEINNLGSKLSEQIQSMEELIPLLSPTFRNHTFQLLAYVKRRYELCLQARKTLEDLMPETHIPYSSASLKDISYSFAWSRNRRPELTQLRNLVEADLPTRNFTYGSSELNRMIAFEIRLTNAGAELPDLDANVKNRAKTATLDSLKIALANLQEIPFDSQDVLDETNFCLTTYRGCVDAFEEAQTVEIQTPVKNVNLWITVLAKCLCFESARSRYREFLLSKL